MSRKNILTKMLAFVLAFALCFGMVEQLPASADNSFSVDNITGMYDIIVTPGKTEHFSIQMKANDPITRITSIIGKSTNPEITVSNAKLTNQTLSGSNAVTDVTATVVYALEFDLTAADTLSIGYNTISFTGRGSKFNQAIGDWEAEFDVYTVTSYTPVELAPAEIIIDKVSYSESSIKPGISTTITLTLKNIGDMQAINNYLTMDFGATGIIPDYSVERIKVGALNAGQSVKVDVPIKILKNAEPGICCITANVFGKDAKGAAIGPFARNMYLTIIDTKVTPTPSPTPAVVKKADIELSTNDNYKTINPDTKSTIVVTLKNNGDADAKEIDLYVNGLDAAIGLTKGFTSEYIKAGSLAAGESKTVEIPVIASKDLAAGLYELGISAEYTFGKDSEKKTNMTLYLKGEIIKKEDPATGAALIELSTSDNYMIVKPETNAVIHVDVKNSGDEDAKDVKLLVSGLDTSVGLTKGYTSEYIKVGKVAAGETVKAEIPVIVSKNFAAGLFEIAVTADYSYGKDSSDKTLMTLYVKGLESAVVTPTPEPTPIIYKNNVSISNVVQDPVVPEAGDLVTISFDVTNEGNGAIKNAKAFGQNLSSSNFEPISSDPYTKIGTINAGGSRNVKMVFKVGDDITSGFNSLSIGFEYTSADDQLANESVNVYVLNVKGKEKGDKKISKPKLIISTFETDEEILKAGQTFNFSFGLKNTHAEKSAKNIKLTFSQAEGIFSPTEGTNIFYINEIKAGEEVVETINLKTRADAVTGDYPVVIQVEYEYDDMSEVDVEHGGVSDENTIKLRAIENYRPVIENINIDSWNGITVGNPVDLSFEFYNMGKSTLGNVYITVEGDFCLANNSEMSYVGAVQGYGQEYVNPQVVPLVGGEAHGTLVVHFEDSNGDEVTVPAEFSAFVDGGFDGGWDGGFDGGFDGGWIDDGGFVDGGFDGGWDGMDGEFPEGGDGEEKTILFGLTLVPFILVCVGVVVVIGAVVAVIVIKKKKAKNAEEDDD